MSQTGTWPPQNVMSRVRSPANTIVMNPLISNGQTLNETSMDMDNYSNSRVAAQMTTTTMMCMDQGQIQHGGRSGTSDVQQHPHMHLQQHLMSSAATSQCFDSNGNGYQMQDTAAQTVPAQQHLFSKLHESLSLEPKYQPNLFLPQESNDGEITIPERDGAAHVLRCLKVWYELSNDILFAAINLVDRFLTKMKVKPKHMACISVGSLHLAIKQLGLMPMDTEDLVAISQCRCTSRDLERMADIVSNKLGVQIGSPPITGLTFIRLFYYIFKNAAAELELSDFYDSAICLQDLEQRMEILACDASCSSIRASELALVLICTQMDSHINGLGNGSHISSLADYAIELQKLCRIPDSSFFHSHSTVVKILSLYNQQQKMPYKQRLVWKLSSRTLRSLRPTDKLKLTSYLPTIEEDNNLRGALRDRTGSVSSEDEDWPTSPVVAVCEQC